MTKFAVYTRTAAMLGALALGAVVVPAGTAKAAGIPVTTTADEFVNNGTCSLREAVSAATVNLPVGGCVAGSAQQPDVIFLHSGATYQLSMPQDPNIADSYGDIDIGASNGPLTITANGAEHATVEAKFASGSEERVFEVSDGAAVLMSRLRITGGSDDNGGGVLNNGTLTLDNSVVSDNFAANNGGGIANNAEAKLTLRGESLVVSNEAAKQGGGAYNYGATMTVEGGSQVTSNDAGGHGGGIASVWLDWSGASLTLREDAMVNLNRTEAGGGGVYLYSGVALFENSVVGANTSREQGGGVFNANGQLSVTGSSLSANIAGSDGDPKGNGGGLANAGIAKLATTTLWGNRSSNAGGGVHNTGALMIENSALHHNLANDGKAFGGAVFDTKQLDLVNTTVSDNGGQYALHTFSGKISLHNSTVAGNSGGLSQIGDAAAIVVSRSIVSDNATDTLQDCAPGDTPSSGGYNVLAQACAADAEATDKVGVDAKLAALGSNGGPTSTRALQLNSPAENIVPLAECPKMAFPAQQTDQRGTPRPQLGGCDAGAYERVVEFANPQPKPAITKLSPATTLVNTGETLVQVQGSGFAAKSEVRWNGAALKTQYISAEKLLASVPAAELDTIGKYPITVYTPAPGGGTSNAVDFEVVALVIAPPPPPPPSKHTIFTPMVGR